MLPRSTTAKTLDRALALGFTAALTACTWTEQRPVRELPSAPTAEPAPPPFIAPPPATEPAAAPTASVDLELPRALRVSVDTSEGATIEQLQALYQPASVADCNPTAPGFLRVVITADDERTAMLVDPKSNADAATSECVLKALSVIDIDELLEPSAADATSNVQSVLTIRW